MNSQSRTLKDIACEEIKERIISGEWPGGTFLSEKLLSELLQMSKTPIRSALDRLEMMGLVKLAPKQGVIVQEVSLQKVLEIYQLRLSLETFAARQLTGRLHPAFWEPMDRNIQAQEEAIRQDNVLQYVRLDKEFHEIMIRGLDNNEFNEVMSRIQDKFLMVVRSTFIKNKERLWSSVDEHKQIRLALAGNDPDHTVELVTNHIEYVKTIML